MRYNSRAVLSAGIAAASCLITSSAMSQHNQTPIPVSDMGIKQTGQSSSLKLTAKNVNCDAPQTFEYAVTGGAWLVPPRNTTITGLGKGQSGTVKATMDFTHTPPGIYYGHVYSRCTSCGWYILSACLESGEDTVIRVKVVDPSIDGEGHNLRDPGNPFANLVSYAPPQIQPAPQISDEDFKLLNTEDRARLLEARNRIITAEANGRAARAAARLARANKNKCDRELALLKAAIDAAKRKSAIAKQDAANAAGAASVAAKAKTQKTFEKDKKRAAAELQVALEGQRAQTEVLITAMNKDGGQGEATKQARAFEKKQDAKVKAARANKAAIDSSYQARKDQANEAARQAAIAKTAAQEAKAAIKTAESQYNAKIKICKGLTKPITDADKAVEDARKFASRAVGIANHEEAEARKAAVKAIIAATRRSLEKLDKDLTDQRIKCANGLKTWDKRMRQITAAKKALTQIGYFKAAANKAANPPTPNSLWSQYKELGYNKFVDVVAAVGGGETMGNTTMLLDVLQAGYGIAKIRQQELLPGTAAHGRSDGSKLRQWLVENNFADLDKDGYDAKNSDARAIEADMLTLKNDRKYQGEMLQRAVESREKCLRDLAVLEKAKAAKMAKKIAARYPLSSNNKLNFIA